MTEDIRDTAAEIDELLDAEEPGAETRAGVEEGYEEYESPIPQVADDASSPGVSSFPGLASFDFSRPHNVSRQFEKNLYTMCENFAKNASLAFTSQLRANTALRFDGLDLVTYGDFCNTLPPSSAQPPRTNGNQRSFR